MELCPDCHDPHCENALNEAAVAGSGNCKLCGMFTDSLMTCAQNRVKTETQRVQP